MASRFTRSASRSWLLLARVRGQQRDREVTGTVSVISTVTDKVERSVAVCYSPFDIGVNAISHTVYVGNRGGSGPATGYAGTVSVIRGTNVDATVNVVGTPSGIGVDSLTNNVYVANSDEEEGNSDVAVINGASRLVTQIPLQAANPQSVTLTRLPTPSSWPTATRAYSSVRSRSSTCYHAEIASVTIGANPWGVAVNPTTDRVYLANDTKPRTVSMVDFKVIPLSGVPHLLPSPPLPPRGRSTWTGRCAGY